MPRDKEERPAKTQDEVQAAEVEQMEGKDPDALKKPRAVKMDDDEYSWEELKANSSTIFEVPAFVLDAAAFHGDLDTSKPLKKSAVKAAINKFQNKEVELG